MTRLSTIGLMLALSAPSFVFAQPDAPPAAFSEAVETEAPDEDSLAWTLAAGGVFNSGNTRSWSITAGTHLNFVSGIHGLSFDWVFAYGRAAARNDDGTFGETTDNARNSNARVRYNLFLTDDDALFAAVAHRWDTFAGLDTRLQLQAGYLRNIFNESNHRLWAEIGYDGTYDDFFYQDEDAAAMMGLPATDFVHSGRIFVAYKNNLNEHVLFTTSLEALFDFQKLDTNTRLNFDAGLQVTVVESLQLGINFKLLFDQEPAVINSEVSHEEVDTITTFNIIYSLI